VKLSVIALDYDGTVARDDRLDPKVRDAIAAARTSGIVVLLVTGRILDELRRVAGELHFVDGVIAENGAVVYFADSEYTSTLAPLIPEAFLRELSGRGIAFRAGRCIVDASADDGPELLDVIRSLELPLVLLFNRGRVMVLPQGVSKATGLHAALDTIRRSVRNTLAVGDAENDHELLRIAEVGAAVEWGSPALQATADVVIQGKGPASVADYLYPFATTLRLPVPPRARRRLQLGHTEDGAEFSLAVKGRNVLITGDARSGKSWVAGLLCEQLILHGYCVCVLDPEGDYRSLEALPGVSVLGGEDPPPTPRELLRALRYPDRSIVIDLSRQPQDVKIEYIQSVLPLLKALRRRTGLPHRILLDEAHYFLHDPDAHRLLDFDLHGYTVVTYCASRLPKELLATTEVMIATCESDPAEIDSLCRCCAKCQHVDAPKWRQQLGHLAVGQAVMLPITEEAGGELKLFTIGRRLTPHVRHREKYVDVPVSDQRAFVFDGGGAMPIRRAKTLREFVIAAEGITPAELGAYLRRGDFSRWVGDVFGDHALAAELHEHEQRFRSGQHLDVVQEMVAAIRSRYDLTEDPVAESFGLATSASYGAEEEAVPALVSSSSI
jgi:hydroxymethylpyrimidine pyrophosphatase-like HAD family hydrolase